MLLGVVIGAAFPNVGKAEWMASLANVFLRLIKSIIAPLIFGTLVYGIAGTGSVKTMGRIGIKAIVYFEVLTTIALVLGLGAVNLVRPGEGMTLERTAGETGLSPSRPHSLGHTGAHLPRQRHRRHGQRRRTANCRLFVSVRRGVRGHRRPKRLPW